MKPEQLQRAREIENELRVLSNIRKEMQDYDPLRNFYKLSGENTNAKFFNVDALFIYQTAQLMHMDECQRVLEQEMDDL